MIPDIPTAQTASADPRTTLACELATLLGGGQAWLARDGSRAARQAMAALARPGASVLIDEACDAIVHHAARFATPRVIRYAHLDAGSMLELGRQLRRDAPQGADGLPPDLLVVTQSLFPDDSCTPRMAPLRAACDELGARLLVDLTHDLGVLGPRGTGHLGMQRALRRVDAITAQLGSHGGLAMRRVAWAAPVHEMPPSDALELLEALGRVRGDEGQLMRNDLMSRVRGLRSALEAAGLVCLGHPSPWVVVELPEEIGTLAAAWLQDHGEAAERIAAPRAPAGVLRLRLPVHAGDSDDVVALRAARVVEAVQQAQAHLSGQSLAQRRRA